VLFRFVLSSEEENPLPFSCASGSLALRSVSVGSVVQQSEPLGSDSGVGDVSCDLITVLSVLVIIRFVLASFLVISFAIFFVKGVAPPPCLSFWSAFVAFAGPPDALVSAVAVFDIVSSGSWSDDVLGGDVLFSAQDEYAVFAVQSQRRAGVCDDVGHGSTDSFGRAHEGEGKDFVDAEEKAIKGVVAPTVEGGWHCQLAQVAVLDEEELSHVTGVRVCVGRSVCPGRGADEQAV
jgi:hypothetical protein